jgi:photosystem II stability/assembly factor-like uncharacterized protein
MVMKKILLFSIALVLSGLSSFAQWVLQNPVPQGNSLNSVFFNNAVTGYAVGDAGTILKTIDGGTTWDSLSSTTSLGLSSVYFTNAGTGYIVGESGLILNTVNGGITWNEKFEGNFPLYSVSFISSNIGFAVGGIPGIGGSAVGQVLKTTNGGAVWNSQWSGGYCLYSVFFSDANTGYAVGTENFLVISTIGTILKTIDGGTTWTASQNYPAHWPHNFYSVCFPDANTGYVVGSEGAIFKTNDGGTTWVSQSSTTSLGLSSVYFTNADTGYIVGDGGIILKTINGGAIWEAQTSPTNKPLNAVMFPDEYTGYISGMDGTILKTTNGGGPVGISEKRNTNSLTIYPNPCFEKITIKFSENGFSLNGTIYVYGMAGQELIKQNIQSTVMELNISSFPAGIYLIRLMNNDKTEFGKFIKE